MTDRTSNERKEPNMPPDEDQIVDLPAKPKKRLVALRWLLKRFERDRRYSPAELHALVKGQDHDEYWRVDHTH